MITLYVLAALFHHCNVTQFKQAKRTRRWRVILAYSATALNLFGSLPDCTKNTSIMIAPINGRKYNSCHQPLLFMSCSL
jgi:hypothetical protein